MSSSNVEMSKRRFGVEIECFGPTKEEIKEALNAAGIPAAIEGYNHDLRSHWKITTDRTVEEGFELVSPPLQGQEGLDLIEKVSKILSAHKARIDHRCGLHVHVEAADIHPVWMLNIIKMYKEHEQELIDKWMPSSRRGDKNEYCKSMHTFFKNFDMEHVHAGTSVDKMLERVRLQRDNRRFKVNLLAFFQHKTIEFRQHGGTVDYKKINPWILFCLNIIELCKVEIVLEKQELSAEEQEKQKSEQKYRILAEILDQHEGYNKTISHERLSELMEIPLNEVQVYVSRFRKRFDLGVEIRRESGYYKLAFGNDKVYKDIVEKEIPPIPLKLVFPHPQDRGPLHGLSPQVISYFEEKKQEQTL